MRKVLVILIVLLFLLSSSGQTAMGQDGQPDNVPLLGSRDADTKELVGGVVINLTSCKRWDGDLNWECVNYGDITLNDGEMHIYENIKMRGDFLAPEPYQHYFNVQVVSVPEGYEIVTPDFDLVGLCGGEYWPFGSAENEDASCTGWKAEPATALYTDGEGVTQEYSSLKWWIEVRKIATVTLAVPALPTVTEAMCTDGVLSDPIVTPAVTEGITYTMTGDMVPGGVVTITATPNEGYELADVVEPYIYDAETGTASYSLTLQNPDCDPVAGTTPDPVDPSPTATTMPVETSPATSEPVETSPPTSEPTAATTATVSSTSSPPAVSGLPSTGTGSNASVGALLLAVVGISLVGLALGTRRRTV